MQRRLGCEMQIPKRLRKEIHEALDDRYIKEKEGKRNERRKIKSVR